MSTNLYDAFESYISQRIKGAPLHLRERRRGILYAKVSTPKEHITLQPVLKFNGDSVLPCPLHEYTGHGTSSGSTILLSSGSFKVGLQRSEPRYLGLWLGPARTSTPNCGFKPTKAPPNRNYAQPRFSHFAHAHHRHRYLGACVLPLVSTLPQCQGRRAFPLYPRSLPRPDLYVTNPLQFSQYLEPIWSVIDFDDVEKHLPVSQLNRERKFPLLLWPLISLTTGSIFFSINGTMGRGINVEIELKS
ncbi:hypothetical protein DFH09DRAFT_1067519 [Mycena vulgaris]|nr:hypothetical protein DFH09DRAFT_1067519 [Mycena vulgaris]